VIELDLQEKWEQSQRELAEAVRLAVLERSEVARLAVKYGAETEVRGWDGSRCDLLGADFVYEVDWARKWSEGVGQAVWYGVVFSRRAGLILLTVDRVAERDYLLRAAGACAAAGLKLLVEDVVV
jgi:hypothetical protein